MDIFLQALSNSAAAWQQAVADVTWHHGAIAATYLAAAWLCLLSGHLSKGALEPHGLWYLAAAILAALAANTILRGDVFLTHLLRELAKLDGWYGARRSLQYLTIALIALVILYIASRIARRFAAGGAAVQPVVWGLAALLMVLAVRIVSAHGTDAVMTLRVGPISVDRLIELAGIGLASFGSLRCLRLR